MVWQRPSATTVREAPPATLADAGSIWTGGSVHNFRRPVGSTIWNDERRGCETERACAQSGAAVPWTDPPQVGVRPAAPSPLGQT